VARVLLLAVLLVACTGSPGSQVPSPRASRPESSPVSPAPSTLPPIPSSSGGSLGPNQPPIVWVGGELTEVNDDRIELKEAFGSEVTLRRLGGNATSFFHVREGTWQRADPRTDAKAGTKACVETLMDGQTLLALRVFLGAECGPTP
jgi:hypothetical protein